MQGIIKSLIYLLIEREQLILEEGAQAEMLCMDICDAMQDDNLLVSLGAWLSNQLIRSPHVAELFASDKELTELLIEL